jgi:RNA polymerase sigma factor for flagellar operon FliA
VNFSGEPHTVALPPIEAVGRGAEGTGVYAFPQAPAAVPATAEGPPDVESLVTTNLPLVGHIVRETAGRLPRHLDTDDLAGAGALALVQAARSFDPSLGVPFARFASTRIKGAMIDHMRSRDWATRSLRSRARALDQVVQQLTNALGRHPTALEIATAAALTTAEVDEIRSGTDRASLLSLDPLAGSEDGLAATLPDRSPGPEGALVAAERMGYLRDAIAELPERMRFVITAYYLEQRPLTEVAVELSVTQSRASQLRAEGLDLLREALQTLLDSDADGRRPLPASPEGRAASKPLGTPAPRRQDRVGSHRAASNGPEEGVRARRRAGYVEAVGQRSSVRARADVQAYLDGSMLGVPRQPRGTAGALSKDTPNGCEPVHPLGA